MTCEQPYTAIWELSSEFGQEKRIAADLSSLLSQRGVRQDRLEEVLTAVGEACLNALEHGNRLRPDRLVEVRMTLTGGSCTFRIYDEGGGFDEAPLADNQAAKRRQSGSRGWGLLFISSFANRISVGFEAGRFYVELLFLLMKPAEGRG